MVVLFSFLTGIAVGSIFFGGLKLTLEYASRVRHPALLVLFSYIARTLLLLGSLIVIAMYSGLAALIPSVIGILVVQVLSMIFARRGGAA